MSSWLLWSIIKPSEIKTLFTASYLIKAFQSRRISLKFFFHTLKKLKLSNGVNIKTKAEEFVAEFLDNNTELGEKIKFFMFSFHDFNEKLCEMEKLSKIFFLYRDKNWSKLNYTTNYSCFWRRKKKIEHMKS